MTREHRIGKLEAEILVAIEARGGKATVKDIFEVLYDRRRKVNDTIAYTTVLTVMTRLHRKGYLRREGSLKQYNYKQTFTVQKVLDMELNRVRKMFQ